MNTEWKEINEDYVVSSNGKVISRKFGRIRYLKPATNRWGYQYVALCMNGVKTYRSIHRLVALAFLGSVEGKEINHKNGIKSDNNVDNLEWVTSSENKYHSYKSLGHKPATGETNGASKLKESQVLDIRERHSSGESIKSIASLYRIHPNHVSKIANFQRWGWLTRSS